MRDECKMLQSSPASAGAGDISERELSRERHNLLTPPARIQRTYSKKQLFLTPISKFTAKTSSTSPNLSRIRSCLEELKRTPARSVQIGPKAVSMEDLTPTKRIKIESKDRELKPTPKWFPLQGVEQRAAARISLFILMSSWRRRRQEICCVRKTLEFQVICSERLRIQVSALKSLLDSDNAKVRLAMRELDRLKQLLREKDLEKAVLEKEKQALEQDISAAEDRVAEMSIGWRNCRNELECARSELAAEQRALAQHRAAADLLRQRGHAADAQISSLEEELARVRRDVSERAARLRREQLARKAAEQRCAELSVLSAHTAQEAQELSARVSELSAELERVSLRWLPAPLYGLAAAARRWARGAASVRAAALWALLPARHGC